MDYTSATLAASELPMALETDGSLSFHDGLICSQSGTKNASGLKPLLYAPEQIQGTEHCYDFYRNVIFPEDEAYFQKYDFRHDLTVIMPGLLGSEYKKTSGHYHGYIPDSTYTYPEIYQVLSGTALFLLQKASDFQTVPTTAIKELKALIVKQGESIVIPPFYGHCSINVGDSPLVFSNLAVASCPLLYEPVQRTHGLSVYVTKSSLNTLEFHVNPNYGSVPDAELLRPVESAAMGIDFSHSIYRMFLDAPDAYRYLYAPGAYLEEMEALLNGTQRKEICL